MRPLEGRRIALLESRKAEDLAGMIRRLGGLPVCTPSLREVPRDDDVRPVLSRLVSGDFALVVVLTAAGGEALIDAASRHAMQDAVLSALGRTVVAVRGPKPLLALRKHGLAAQVVTGKPHTTQELLEALAPIALTGARVLLLHYGEPSPALTEALANRGAIVEDVRLYDWALPIDLGPLRQLMDDVIARRIDAMLFTSQVQLRHLLAVARAEQMEEALTRALRDEVIVGAVGPVCASALRAAGVIPDVTPRSPNGPSLVQALADYHSIIASERTSREPA